MHWDTCLQFFGGLNQTVVICSYGWVLRLFPFLFCCCRQTAISILAISVPWASHFMSPCICFSTCNMGLIILPTSEDCGRIKCGNCNKDLEWGQDTVSAQLTFVLLGSLQALCYSGPSRVSAFETPESGGHWLMEHGVTGRRKHGGGAGKCGSVFHRGDTGFGSHAGPGTYEETVTHTPMCPWMSSLGICPDRDVAAAIHWTL